MSSKKKKNAASRNTKKTEKRKNGRAVIFGIAVTLLLAVIITAAAVFPGKGKQSVICAQVGGNNRVTSFIKGGEAFLVLPAAGAENGLTLVWDGGETLSCGGEKSGSGETVSWYEPSRTSYDVKFGGDDVKLNIIRTGDLPSVFIDTETGSMDAVNADKEHKESGALTVYENGKQTLQAQLNYIKGRGNSTWEADKKPYNIAFAEKTEFLGMAEAKKWCLLSEPYDNTHMKNALGFAVAELFGCKNTPEGRYAQLYLNGEYAGLYYVTEKVEIGKNRIAITDLEKLNEKAAPEDKAPVYVLSDEKGKTGSSSYRDGAASPADVTGGYLLEIDRPAPAQEENAWFFSDTGLGMVVKSPENVTREESAYISSLWNEAEEAVYSAEGRNAAGRHYSEYFDTESLVNWFLSQEFIMQSEAGVSSTFFYKDAGEELFYAGPVWDMDASFGMASGDDAFRFSPSDSLMLPCVHVSTAETYSFPSFYAALFRQEDFREALAERWRELRKTVTADCLTARAKELCETVSRELLPERLLTSQFEIFPGVEVFSASQPSFADEFTSFIQERVEAFDIYFGKMPAAVFYCIPDGSSFMADEKMSHRGDAMTVKSPDAVAPYLSLPEGKTVAGWSEKPDGKGDIYRGGEEITVNGSSVILYAVW